MTLDIYTNMFECYVILNTSKTQLPALTFLGMFECYVILNTSKTPYGSQGGYVCLSVMLF